MTKDKNKGQLDVTKFIQVFSERIKKEYGLDKAKKGDIFGFVVTKSDKESIDLNFIKLK